MIATVPAAPVFFTMLAAITTLALAVAIAAVLGGWVNRTCGISIDCCARMKSESPEFPSVLTFRSCWVKFSQ